MGIHRAGDSKIAVAGLLTGAFVWGIVWYPFRQLQEEGLSGVVSTTLVYWAALLVFLPLGWRRLVHARPKTVLLVMGLASGACNLGYVLAVLEEEVLRVLLLFYLAPLWTILLSRLVLKEKLTAWGVVVVMLSLVGAMVLLWSDSAATVAGFPWPRSHGEWLGLLSGFFFALSNVLSRSLGQVDVYAKCAAQCAGVVACGIVIFIFTQQKVVGIHVTMQMWGLMAMVCVAIVAVNMVVQFGLSCLPANRAIVLLLFELVVAAAAGWALAEEELSVREMVGAMMIATASFFSDRVRVRNVLLIP